jgi:carbamoyl-phosphate synthase small subunit
VRELARLHSNFRATTDLDTWLRQQNVLGLTGIDTRALTRRLRSGGAMPGALTDDASISDEQLVEIARAAPDMSGQNLVPGVGCSASTPWSESLGDWAPGGAASSSEGGERRFRVLALDCGAKRNILRNLTDRGCAVTVIPHDTAAEEIKGMLGRGEADGLFISNGPGDPAAVEQTIAALRELLTGPGAADATIPTFGICLGHQLLSLALGAKTFKLKFGHRGANQPVLNTLSRAVEITSQNHGFAVDPESLPEGAEITHINLNDQTCAGFRLKDRPVFAVQHHPEASPGPHDAGYLFDAFVEMMRTGQAPTAETMRRRVAVRG